MKVGFAFLTYKLIYNKKTWKNFFDKIDYDFEVSIHAKRKPKNKLPFKANYIKKTPTEWGKPGLVRATFFLLTDLFSRGCDVVYFVSGDTIPLPKCVDFVNKNTESNFHLQPKSCKQKFRLKKFKQTSLEFQNKVEEKEFRKQNMFFCISRQNFLDLNRKIGNEIDKYNFYKFKEKLFPEFGKLLDEYFWVNLFKYYNIPFITNNRYIYCNSSNGKRTQAQSFNHIPEKAKNEFIFMRKVKFLQ